MIRKVGDKWVLFTKDGSRRLGTHATEADALAQERAVEVGKHMKNNEMRQLHLRGALGAPRTTLWDGREHLVVPVVALMDGVIHAVNAKTPERVTTQVLAASSDKWNGHPLVVGHTVRNGQQVTAHDPSFEKQRFGLIREAKMNGPRLGMEALVDPARLEAMGQRELLADLRAGKPVDVSVGAYVRTSDAQGEHNGKKYLADWTEIAPDHLAFLPGGRGACSGEMGCGANRQAEAYLVTAEGFEVMEEDHMDKIPKGMTALKARILALFDTPEQAASEEAAEMVRFDTLRATCDAAGDAWDEIDALIDELIEAEATHAAGAAEEAETELEAAKLEAIRTHCLAMSGAISAILGMTYPPPPGVAPGRYMEAIRAAAGARNSAADMKTIQGIHDHAASLGAECDVKNAKFLSVKTDCPACDGTGQTKTDDKQTDCPACNGTGQVMKAAETTDGNPAVEGEDNMDKKAAIKALTACPCSGFTAADVTALEAFSEERLTALAEGSVARKAEQDKAAADLKAATDKAAETDAALKAAQAAQIPAEELTSLRALADERKAADAKEAADLVAKLKTAAAGVYTEEQLKAKPLAELRSLAALTKVETPRVDFSGRGIPVPRSAGGGDFKAPDGYAPGIKALQAQDSKAVN